MPFFKQADNSEAEERLTRAIQRIREQYKGDFAAFFRDYHDSVNKRPSQRELPLQSGFEAESSHE